MATSSARISPITRESTAGLIADRIRAAIADGTFAPGMQLAETQLAEELGVSRGPLREGMQRLTQEGLLVSHRNRGVFVLEMTPDTVRDMYLARAAVERAAAREIFQHDPEAAGAQLLRAADRMATAATRSSKGALSNADFDFHEELVSLAASERLSRMHQTLLTETRLCIHASEGVRLEAEVRVANHRAIAQGFIDHDPDETDRLLLEHMEESSRLLSADAADPIVR